MGNRGIIPIVRAVSRKENTLTETIICEECHKEITWPHYNHNRKVLCRTCYQASLDAESADLPPQDYPEEAGN
jgi:uncharacterized CHY-type Zn-finger protein